MKSIRLSYLIIIVLLIALIAVFRYHRFRYYPKYIGSNEHIAPLVKEAKKFNRALRRNDTKSIYHMFNSSFRSETRLEVFDQAFSQWLNNRKITAVQIQQIGASYRTGFVSCMIRFHNNSEMFLYQSWINTNAGWKIVWLNRVLPRELLNYGDDQLTEIQIIKQLALNELFNNRIIHRVLNQQTVPRQIFLEIIPDQLQIDLVIPDHTITQLPLPEILQQAPQTESYFWIEFAMIRIIDDIASIYIDIHPLYRDIPNLSRSRGIQLYFIKKDGMWCFDSPGSHW